jgi:hypothetical protein
MPHFRKGYDERLDLTEDEWLEQELYEWRDIDAIDAASDEEVED